MGDCSEGSLQPARECGADETVLADGGEVEAIRELTDGVTAAPTT